MSKNLGKLAGKSFTLRIIAAGVTYAFVVALARMMSVQDFGIVGTLMSGALLFSIIGSAGQQMALLRFVPPLIESDSAPVPRSLISRAVRLAATGNTIIYILLIACVFIAQAFGQIDQAVWISFGVLIVPLTGMIDMQSHLARAYKAIALAIIPKDILWRLLSLLLIGSVFFITQSEVPLYIALITLVGVLATLILLQGALIQKRLGVPSIVKLGMFQPNEPRDPNWVAARFPHWVSSVTAVLFTNLDVVAAGVLIGPEAAALYFAANRIALVPSMFSISYNIVVGPIFAGHYAAGRKKEMSQVARAASLQVFVPTFISVVLLMVFTYPVLRLFGPEFTQSASVLRLLLLAALVRSALGPNDLILNMCGEERHAMQAALWGTCIGGALVFWGAWSQDIIWLAIGTCAATTFARVLSWIKMHKSLGFSADVLTAIRYNFFKGSI